MDSPKSPAQGLAQVCTVVLWTAVNEKARTLSGVMEAADETRTGGRANSKTGRGAVTAKQKTLAADVVNVLMRHVQGL